MRRSNGGERHSAWPGWGGDYGGSGGGGCLVVGGGGGSGIEEVVLSRLV